MPASKSRVTRSTAASRSKSVAAKKIPQRKNTVVATSPGWVTGHPSLFKTPESISPKRPNTRRTSRIYQRVSSPSRYKNAKIPSSNCRRSGQTKGTTNNSPIRYGVMTRARRSSVYSSNAAAAPLILTPMSPPAPFVKPPAPVRSSSRRSAKSKDSSKTSLKQESQKDLVFCKPVPVESESSVEKLPSGEVVQLATETSTEAIAEMATVSLEQPSPSAMSIKSADQSSVKSQKSTSNANNLSASANSVDSMFPGKSIPKLAESSPTPSEEFVVPSPSDPEISFNAGKNNIATPRSKRFLESIEASPIPTVTQSFYPSSAKRSKMDLPISAKSEKILTSTQRKLRSSSVLENSIGANSSGISGSFSIIPQLSKIAKTPSGTVRDISLKDISACSSRLDSTNPLDIYQTPKIQKSMLENQTLFETPDNSADDAGGKENKINANGSVASDISKHDADLNGSIASMDAQDSMDVTQSSGRSRCIIL